MTCTLCHGRGWVEEYIGDSYSLHRVDCNCRDLDPNEAKEERARIRRDNDEADRLMCGKMEDEQ